MPAIQNYGVGALSAVFSGNVAGRQRTGAALYNFNAATDLTLDVGGDLVAITYGVYARNLGSGATTISVAGAIDVATPFYANPYVPPPRLGSWIYVDHAGIGALTIAVGDVTNADTGVRAITSGAGPTIVTATGTLRKANPGYAASDYAIKVSAGSGDVTVNANNA